MQIEQNQWHPTQGWEQPWPGSLGDRAQLILLFGDMAAMHTPLWDEIRHAYPQAHAVGCSTAGEIYGTQVLEGCLTLTAIAFEHTQVQGCTIQLAEGESSLAAGDRLGAALPKENLTHVFVLSEGIAVNGSDLIRGLTAHLPAGVTLTGGLSGDGDRFTQTQVLWDGMPQAGQIAAVGFYGDRLTVGYGSLGGWTPFGPDRLITKANGNTLFELDGQPALEVYKKYLGPHADELPAAGLLFPLSLRLVDGSLPGDRRLVRTILSIDEATQSLTFAGNIPEGGYAQLMHASVERLVDGAIEAAEKSQAPFQQTAPQLAILISCVGRKLLMKQRIEEEIEGVQEVLGAATPLTGFYSYGEICPFLPGLGCELHNQTMTITTFAEA